MCEMYSLPVIYNENDELSTETIEDRVILETEITLKTGPNITMQIHEESRSSSVISGLMESEEDSKKQGVIKVLNDDDSESDYYEETLAPRTPRKVRFGGECVKLRTPESDSSQQDMDADDNNMNMIKITVTDAVSIRTRKSLIPIRISSLPSTPKKQNNLYKKSSRSHKSAPSLLNVTASRIPLLKKPSSTNKNKNLNLEVAKPQTDLTSSQEISKLPKESKLPRKPSLTPRLDGVLSPVPIHKEIEVFHNLTRSPDEKKKTLLPTPPALASSPLPLPLPLPPPPAPPPSPKPTEQLEEDNSTNQTVVIVESPKLEDPEKNYDSFTIFNNNNEETKTDRQNLAQTDTMISSVVIEEIDVDKTAIEPAHEPLPDKNNLIVNDKKATIQQSLSSLASEDELWIKSEALESLVKMLKQPGTCESLESGPAALLLEAIFACHHRDRLHNLADDALTILIEGLRDTVLEECLPRLSLGLCKIGGSSAVQVTLTVMKKLSPKKFQLEVLSRAFGHRTREGALQILMAAGRLYPNTDVEVTKITEFASAALKDRRRRIKQAALETLAVMAQLTSPSDVLVIVKNKITDFSDYEDVLEVVRIRLSRRQLPSVDLDGIIKYSSPIDQIESDWISGSALLKKQQQSSSSPLSSASSSTPSMNYWMHNSRHDNNNNNSSNNGSSLTNGSLLVKQLSGSLEEDSFDDPSKLWTLDLKNNENFRGQHPAGVIHPLYLVPTRNGHNQNYDRGRSFSPPKRHKGCGTNDMELSSSNGGNSLKHFGYSNEHSNRHYNDFKSHPNGGMFKKSFSSDQLYFGDKLHTNPVAVTAIHGNARNDHYSHSLSSRSSSISTGSSTKSGYWHRDIRSGIPVPISSEIKLKFRQGSSLNTPLPSGPVIAKRSALSNNSNISSPHQNYKTSTTTNTTATANNNNNLQLPISISSGSESSGYYTPSPPETHQPAFIKMDTEERLSSDFNDDDDDDDDNDDYEEEEPPDPLVNNNNNNSNSNRLNGEGSFTKSSNSKHNNEPSNTSTTSSIDTRDYLGETIHDKFPSIESINLVNSNECKEMIQSRTPSGNVIITESSRSRIEVRRKSKSVIDLQNFLPQINSGRKIINSAPIRNDVDAENGNFIKLYERTAEPSHSMNYSAPVASEQEATTPAAAANGTIKTKLERRFSRNDRRRSTRNTVKVPDHLNTERPYSKPKEALQHILNQLENADWEIIIDGLHGLIRMAKYNPETIENQMHQVCLDLAKHIKNLRSQVARVACNTVAEIFKTCKRGLEMELEELACPLLQRTADTNKFLRADANTALDVMCEQLPVHRVIPVITTRGCSHQNPIVRAASVRLLGDIVKRFGAERIFQMPKELKDKILLAGANSLADGNLDARSYGKMMFRYLIGYHGFQKQLYDAVPQNLIRHISKVLASIKLGN